MYNCVWSKLASQDTRMPSQRCWRAQDARAMPSDQGWQAKTQGQCQVNEPVKRTTQEQCRVIEVGKPRHKRNVEWSRLASQNTIAMPNDRGWQAQDARAMTSDRGWQAKTQKQWRVIEVGKPRHKGSAKSMSLSSARHKSNAEWSRLANQDTKAMPSQRLWQAQDARAMPSDQGWQAHGNQGWLDIALGSCARREFLGASRRDRQTLLEFCSGFLDSTALRIICQARAIKLNCPGGVRAEPALDAVRTNAH